MFKSLKPSEFDPPTKRASAPSAQKNINARYGVGVEPKILKFWQEKKIFEKSLAKKSPKGEFIFYDGPPFATGLPHYGHILASTIKDLIPRYKTMQGYFVRRRWGWDCHGLPIEEIVERQLGISGKKQIEEIGIKKFNETCRSKVLEYADEWGKAIKRIARWIDFDNSYKTMDRDYMESVWWGFKQIYERGLVYEGKKVLIYCPRCETPVSNFEVAMDNSYKDVEEETIIVKFKIQNSKFKITNQNSKLPIYLLAWTTTPWTLPTNIALAIGKNIDYSILESNTSLNRGIKNGEMYLSEGYYIVASDRVPDLIREGNYFTDNAKHIKGKDLIDLEYEPLYKISEARNNKSYKVYPADFVSTEEGTGIVHIAPAHGEDDYKLGQKNGLETISLLDEKGKFTNQAPEFLRGLYFKKANELIINDLEKRGLLFNKEKQIHSYPHCWRCGNALYYSAIPAWFINIQKIKKGLIESNNKEISWYPEHLKHGRYEKSVEQAPDWNISRNRYWGNPIPVWKCEKCSNIKVAGSIKELGLSSNTFYFSRHAESKINVLGKISCYPEKEMYDLTEKGVEQAKNLAKEIKKRGGVDLIFASDLLRTKRTAEIIGKELNVPVAFDKQLREYNSGEYNGRLAKEFEAAFPDNIRWTKMPEGGENWTQVQKRMADFIQETDKKYKNKKILVISHGDPLRMIKNYYTSKLEISNFAELFEISVGIRDIHRPYIDDVILKCEKCRGKMKRVKEIFDSWTEAGSMPFSEYHYPFDNKDVFEKRFPAQFVAEYISQTRAWFYVMHVISYLLFNKTPFQNVVTTGTILAEDGSKMSKSKNNFPDPWQVIEKYGVDALRFYLMNSVVMQADNLNFSEKDLEIIYRRVIVILFNVYNFFKLYANEAGWKNKKSEKTKKSVLDKWILSRTNELISAVTENFDNYDTVKATRLIAEYIEDLSTWYLRRSRDRKDDAFFSTLYKALIKTSQVIAPVMPYISEFIYVNLTKEFGAKEKTESVHLTDWPKADKKLIDKKLNKQMTEIRRMASLALAKRAELKIKVRQPLASLSIKHGALNINKNGELLKILADEINVKEIVFNPKINPPGSGEIELDEKITPELKAEGNLRDLIRIVQDLRKEVGLKPKDKINLWLEMPKEVEFAVNKFIKEFKEKIGAKNVAFERNDKFDAELETKIDEQELWVGIKKI